MTKQMFLFVHEGYDPEGGARDFCAIATSFNEAWQLFKAQQEKTAWKDDAHIAVLWNDNLEVVAEYEQRIENDTKDHRLVCDGWSIGDKFLVMYREEQALIKFEPQQKQPVFSGGTAMDFPSPYKWEMISSSLLPDAIDDTAILEEWLNDHD